ncbi:ribonuclease III [Nitratireductor mangrovi]|uniref:Ribonuclease 3 n=1 Tax=Nitratireductor mangrovi TaxID=2599600 RepID=A0A5B8KTK4_9HYPH|nr:ribonuclease III [Nitratireductor mangrovi]QDY98921.1 ribonuclease III [Nitratireductor mangrovi]
MSFRKRPSGAALVEALRERTGYAFRDQDRLERALTHASARRGTGSDYERLEFLGDRVLGLVVSDMLFHAFPGAPEGELALRLNALVSGEACAEVAEEIGLADFIRAEAGLRSAKGRKGRSTRADVMEALIAAIYLDGGLEAVRPFVLRYWEPRSRAAAQAVRDAKTELQEWAHQSVGTTPVYALKGREGPDHEPLFTVTVTVGDLPPATGSGRAKREAEQAAAGALLVREGVWNEPEPVS